MHGRRLHGDECDRYIALAIAAAEEVPVEDRPISPYAVAAGQAMLRRDSEATERYGRVALELAEKGGDLALAADIRVTLGSVAAASDSSLRELHEAVDLAQRAG